MIARALVCLLVLASAHALASDSRSRIDWKDWTPESLEAAKKSGKLMVLDLVAVWCHWCHVMDEKTYSDPRIIEKLGQSFVALKADQDARPDLSARYGDYGWPATIFFDSKGRELAYRQGFVEPDEYLALITKLAARPVPEPAAKAAAGKKREYAKSPSLAGDLESRLRARHVELYDPKNHGWGTGHKYLDWNSVEYSMVMSRRGEASQSKMARETLQAELALLDPVWGGVFQYSTHGDWNHPHFEKIMEYQAAILRAYSLAYAQWGNSADLKAAQAIRGYLKTFLSSPEGAFYVSQDADLVPGQHSADYFSLPDSERRKRGIPRVDQHVYSRENGWAIQALVALHAASGERDPLEDALRAAAWIEKNRSLAPGGFRHDEKDAGGPFLGDTLAMGAAFLALYSATGDRAWLAQAEAAGRFIELRFGGGKGAGYAPALAVDPQRSENIDLARFANSLSHYSGKPEFRKIAERAMRFLATPSVALERRPSGILLAARELAQAPVHVTVVGHKDDPAAQALVRAALALPESYKRIDWWDKREGPMPNPDVQYPELAKAAAFACTQGRCSLPVFKPDALARTVQKFYQ
ncbi:MAG TPA: DUF255 domain-containing protein [Bdellovibrionota bacterium]|nr:DUF255 domain-containing protein [Bdellovibrionota bacterium]